jgi:hypothetical protein
MSLELDIADIKNKMEQLLALLTPQQPTPLPTLPPLTQEMIDACLLTMKENESQTPSLVSLDVSVDASD